MHAVLLWGNVSLRWGVVRRTQACLLVWPLWHGCWRARPPPPAAAVLGHTQSPPAAKPPYKEKANKVVGAKGVQFVPYGFVIDCAALTDVPEKAVSMLRRSRRRRRFRSGLWTSAVGGSERRLWQPVTDGAVPQRPP